MCNFTALSYQLCWRAISIYQRWGVSAGADRKGCGWGFQKPRYPEVWLHTALHVVQRHLAVRPALEGGHAESGVGLQNISSAQQSDLTSRTSTRHDWREPGPLPRRHSVSVQQSLGWPVQIQFAAIWFCFRFHAVCTCVPFCVCYLQQQSWAPWQQRACQVLANHNCWRPEWSCQYFRPSIMVSECYVKVNEIDLHLAEQ